MRELIIHEKTGVLIGVDPRTGIGFGHTFSRDEKGEQYKSPSDIELDLRANAGMLLTAAWYFQTGLEHFGKRGLKPDVAEDLETATEMGAGLSTLPAEQRFVDPTLVWQHIGDLCDRADELIFLAESEET